MCNTYIYVLHTENVSITRINTYYTQNMRKCICRMNTQRIYVLHTENVSITYIVNIMNST